MICPWSSRRSSEARTGRSIAATRKETSSLRWRKSTRLTCISFGPLGSTMLEMEQIAYGAEGKSRILLSTGHAVKPQQTISERGYI